MSERIDDLQYKGLKLIQNTDYFCFGTDAVLLANFTEVKTGERIVEFGTGTGIIPVLLSGRNMSIHISAIEIQPELVEIARRNVELNNLQNMVDIINGNLKESNLLISGKVDAVVCNPPYEKAGSGKQSSVVQHRIARHEIECNLEEVIKSAAKLLGTGGRFYMIHRAKRTAEIIYRAKQNRLEPKVMRFIQAHNGEEPGYLLIKCVKDAAEEIKIMPPLIMYDENGNETDEIKKIYHRYEE